MLLWVVFAGSACQSTPPVGTPATSTSVPQSSTSAPQPIPTVTPTITPVDALSLEAALLSTLQAELPATLTPAENSPSAFLGIHTVHLIPFQREPYRWAAVSSGERSYTPLQNHFVSIYEWRQGLFQPLGTVELPNSDQLEEGSARQVMLEPEGAWFVVEGKSGAHGGCFDLLRFDKELSLQASNCSSSPTAGELVDLNQDGILEVALNWSDDYVFCYACGVKQVDYQLWRWDGHQLMEITLQELPSTASQDVVALNHQMLNLANAGLWKDAAAQAEKVGKLLPEEETLAWNVALIRFKAERLAESAADSPFPLLAQVFVGDYEAAVATLQSYRPQELFSAPIEILRGTLAEGQEERVATYLLAHTQRALDVQPDRAAAQFLRGWALFMQDPTSRKGFEWVIEAARNDPENTFFAETAAYLK